MKNSTWPPHHATRPSQLLGLRPRESWQFAVLICSMLWVAAARVPAADAPFWGEPFTRNMVSTERGLPDSFDPAGGKNIRWKAVLGTETYSTPVIGGGRVLVGTNNGQPRDPRHKGDRGVLMCFNEHDGRFLWQLVVPKLTNSIYWDWPNAGVCSTATIDGNRIYVVSNRGEVLCLDLEGMANGNDGPYQDEARHAVPANRDPIEPGAADADILWLFDIVKECGVRQHDSAHSSILVHGQFLYVNTSNGVDDSHRHIDAPDAPALIVLDKATGRWIGRDAERMGPRTFHSTWSSPALAEVNGRTLVFFGGGDGVVYAFEALTALPASGEVVSLKRHWRFDCDPTGPKENVHQYNSNRRVSPSNIKSIPVFHENHVYVTVGGDLWWGKNEAWLKCIDARLSGEVTSSAGRWSYTLDRHCMASPAVWKGLAFAADCSGKIHCVDAKSGTAHWVHEAGAEIWSSPLVVDGRLYVGTRGGTLWELAAEKEKRVLAQIDLGGPLHGTPVAANGVLYLATMKTLYAVQASSQ